MSKFGSLIDGGLPVLICFYKAWHELSEPTIQPILRDVAAALGDHAKVIKIDVDKNPELAEALRIKTLPTLIVYQNGEMRWRHSGEQDANSLIAIIQKYAKAP